MNAAQANDRESASWLLDNGSDPDAADDRGFTSLHRAAEMGHIELVRLLIAGNASPNPVAQGHTPVALARARDHADVVAALGGA